MEYNQWIPDLMKLVRKAGDEILHLYNSHQDLHIDHKKDDSPVTKADLRSNQILVEGLQTLHPDIPIVSEENKAIPFDVRKNFEKFWIIDPLDGTKEYIQRLDEFSIHLALVEGGKITLGIIHVPVFDEMYYGAKGLGAWQVKEGEKFSLRGHPVDYHAQQLRVVRSRSHLDAQTEAFIEQLDQPHLITMGSGLKFMRLITGDADYYPRAHTNMYEWDVAPAQIILEEAGGGIFDWDTGESLSYNKENLKITGFQAISYGTPPNVSQF